VAEYRVDELAHRAGTSVRNVRVYQDRGLLAPPRRQGRVGYYSDSHLERLRLIGRLLERGYTFSTIGELLAAWSEGGGLGEVLGLTDLTDAIGGTWSEEPPGHVTAAGLRRRFGVDDTSAFMAQAVELGLLEPEGAAYRVPSPHLLEAGADLVAAGIPLSVVLDLAVALRARLDGVAELFFHAVATHLPGLADDVERGSDPADHEPLVDEHVAESVARLRPHAGRAVEAMFALAMQARAEQAVETLNRGRHLEEDDRLTG
jgi:DNA-binding transcriptional MerR regulator